MHEILSFACMKGFYRFFSFVDVGERLDWCITISLLCRPFRYTGFTSIGLTLVSVARYLPFLYIL